MKIYKLAFIGAGPATLAAIGKIDPNVAARSIVLEAGSRRRQTCPELKTKTCSSCNGALCPTLQGFGGASYGFGNKICHFPASNHLAAREPNYLLKQVSASVDNVLKGANLIANCNEFSAHTGSKLRKSYAAEIALADDYQEIVNRLALQSNDLTEIRTGFNVGDISYSKGSYKVRNEIGDEICAERLVFGVGRSGYNLIRKHLPKLEVRVSENEPDIGFRIQAETDLFAPEFFYQTDPKYKFSFDGIGSGRTFCACKGGIVVPVKFGSAYYADGVFSRTRGKKTNVALMARTKKVEASELERWCAEHNASNGQSIALGSFECTGLSDVQLGDKIKELMIEGPSNAHRTVLEKLVDQFFKDQKASMIASGDARVGKIELFGPAIDRYWPSIDESSLPISEGRISVIGDALGQERGILQAMASGFAWASKFNRSTAIGTDDIPLPPLVANQ